MNSQDKINVHARAISEQRGIMKTRKLMTLIFINTLPVLIEIGIFKGEI